MEVLKYPAKEKILRQPGLRVTPSDITPEFILKLEKMKEVLKLDGMGLAATQVGWPVQIFLLCQDAALKECPVQVFLNPVILESSTGKKRDSEGCLSFPGLFLDIERSEKITWQYQDLDFNVKIQENSGYYARAIMHEIDHLNGRLMIDGISNVHRLKVDRWLRGLKRR